MINYLHRLLSDSTRQFARTTFTMVTTKCVTGLGLAPQRQQKAESATQNSTLRRVECLLGPCHGYALQPPANYELARRLTMRRAQSRIPSTKPRLSLAFNLALKSLLTAGCFFTRGAPGSGWFPSRKGVESVVVASCIPRGQPIFTPNFFIS
jgi:hypothetical protein